MFVIADSKILKADNPGIYRRNGPSDNIAKLLDILWKAPRSHSKLQNCPSNVTLEPQYCSNYSVRTVQELDEDLAVQDYEDNLEILEESGRLDDEQNPAWVMDQTLV